MVRKILAFTLLLFATTAMAQNLETFKGSLTMANSESEGVVEIYESQDAKSALAKINQSARKNNFLGYRIGIFFDNGATARHNANEAKKLFEQKFPDEELYMVYENPYFKVSVGNCVTQEEAVILLDKVQKVFPKAYLMREQMEVADIIEK
ncbi:MAG: hypothetical protein SNG27_01235 [Rikenellaceae bacterium]